MGHGIRTSPVVLLALAAIVAERPAAAQEVVITSEGQVIRTAPASPPQQVPPRVVRPGGAPGMPGAKPGAQPAKKPGASPQAGQEKTEEKPPRRRRKPRGPVDPKALQQPLGPDGRIAFNLDGHPWEGILQWLADLAGRTLVFNDQLPEDATLVGFRTRHRYTIDEALDKINGVLLGTEGFTLLDDGEIITVNKVEGLNPGLVPAVEPAELDNHPANSLVKVIFPLRSLVAEKLTESLKSMVTKYGKVTALAATNRIEVLDTARNLKRIWNVLQEEQSAEHRVKEFALEHARAEDVAVILRTLLGIEEKSAAPMTPQQAQQAAQLAMQQAQKAAQQGGQPTKEKPEVHLAVNARRNSILITGPPDQIAIAEAAIERIDVAETSDTEVALSPFDRSEMRIYYLTAVSPETVTEFLQKTGELAPSTRLQVEPRSQSILAWATLADHALIGRYVEEIDGNGRTFDVVQLTVLDAEQAAGSIDFLINGKRDDDDSNQRRRSYIVYDPFSSRGSRQQQEPKAQFRVEADVERNRLLLYATKVELAQVQELLRKMGEPDATASATNGPRLRVVPLAPGDTNRLLEQLERLWPNFSPGNPLQTVPRSGEQPGAVPDTGHPDQGTPAKTGAVEATTHIPPRRDAPGFVLAALADQAAQDVGGGGNPPGNSVQGGEPESAALPQSPASPQSAEAASEGPTGNAIDLESLRNQARQRMQPAPISVIAGPDGLTIYSPDPEVAERMVKLIESLVPPQPEYTVFYLKKAFADDVVTILEDMFKEEEDGRSGYEWDPWYGGYYRSGSQTASSGRLSKRKELKIVSDPETNAVFVRGSTTQIAQIGQMIQILDSAPPQDAEAVRTPHLVQLRNTQAKEVAEIITSVYRDFLSPNDPGRGKGGNQGQSTQARYVYQYNIGSGGSGSRKLEGLLSVGVDERANTLVISAPQDLFAEIKTVIDDLEQAAVKPRNVMRVVGLRSGTPPLAVVGALGSVLGRKPAEPKKGQQPEAKEQSAEAQQKAQQEAAAVQLVE